MFKPDAIDPNPGSLGPEHQATQCAGKRLSHIPRSQTPRPARAANGQTRKASIPRRHLVLMVKAPSAGRVKTRLARGIGNARAAAFYRTVTNTVLSRLCATPRWQTYLSISPDEALDSRAWPFESGGSEILRIAQGNGDLGQRLQRLMDGMPSGPVVVVGSDVPGITSDHIETAFRTLGTADAVFGPSPDGGYWLVGMRRTPRVIRGAFDGVRWSSSQALSDTLGNFDGLSVAQIDELDDVDEVGDLDRFGLVAARRIPPA